MAGITTTTEISAPVNVVYQTALLRRAQMVLPYFVGSVPGDLREHQGSFTVKWRRYEHLTPTTTALTELTGNIAFPTRVAAQPSITDVTATVSKYGQFIFLTEEADLVNINNVAMELSEVLGEQAGRSLNRLQRNEVEDNFTAAFTSSATTATGVAGGSTASGFIKLTAIANVVNTLDRNDARKFLPMTLGSTNIGSAPVRESYWGIAHPDVVADLRTLTGWNSVETYAGQTETAIGEVGHVGGVRWVETSEASIDATTGVASTGSATTHGRSTATRYDVYSTPIFGQNAVGTVGLGFQHVKDIYRAGDNVPGIMMISHAKGSGGVADPLDEVATIGWKSWHAPKVLNSTWGRTLKTAASILQSNE